MFRRGHRLRSRIQRSDSSQTNWRRNIAAAFNSPMVMESPRTTLLPRSVTAPSRNRVMLTPNTTLPNSMRKASVSAGDLKLAACWYRRAALQGVAEAQNNLGVLYATGRGVGRNDAAAVHWYGLAAEQNDPKATSNLGMMYLEGRGVKRDFAKAFQLFGRAAEQGYAIAQNNLALMYANGQAVVRDYVSACAWLDVAAQEISGCSELRDRVAEEMTAEEIARARELANRKREQLAQKLKVSK
jgi:hypothetical protein